MYWKEEYLNLLFAKAGKVFRLDERQTIVMGRAYGIVKMLRLMYGYGWCPDEQPFDENKRYVESQLNKLGWKMNMVLSHTTSLKYESVEVFMAGVD